MWEEREHQAFVPVKQLFQTNFSKPNMGQLLNISGFQNVFPFAFPYYHFKVKELIEKIDKYDKNIQKNNKYDDRNY